MICDEKDSNKIFQYAVLPPKLALELDHFLANTAKEKTNVLEVESNEVAAPNSF